MQVELVCRDKPFKNVPCLLVLEDGEATLTADGGEVVAGEYCEDFDSDLEFPSFSASVKYLAVRFDERILSFNAAKADVKALRLMLDGAIAKTDPGAMNRLATKAKLYIAGGIAAIIAGPLLSMLSYHAVADRGGRYYIWYGLSFFGLASLVKGVSMLRRVRAIKLMAVSNTS